VSICIAWHGAVSPFVTESPSPCNVACIARADAVDRCQCLTAALNAMVGLPAVANIVSGSIVDAVARCCCLGRLWYWCCCRIGGGAQCCCHSHTFRTTHARYLLLKVSIWAVTASFGQVSAVHLGLAICTQNTLTLFAIRQHPFLTNWICLVIDCTGRRRCCRRCG